jgi:Flp pilus assembly protein TadD
METVKHAYASPARFGTAITRILAGALIGSALLAAPVYAAGEDTSATKTCPKGQVWNKKEKKCVTEKSAVMPDKERTTYAYALAKKGRYEEALAQLDRLSNPKTAKALNYRGYATRKLGRTDEGISYYLQSVALDPQYAKVREYLGEAYVIKGRLDLASAQLDVIKSICGQECEEYKDLSEAIADSPVKPASL